jgi:hypothetical protein
MKQKAADDQRVGGVVVAIGFRYLSYDASAPVDPSCNWES